MSCLLCKSNLPTTHEGCTIYVYYYSSLIMECYTPIFISSSCDSVSLSSLYFPCACMWELSYSNIYFLCFFFASRLYYNMLSELQFIHGIKDFLHGIRAQVCSSSTELRSYLFSLLEHIESLIPLWRRACIKLTRFSPSFICAGYKDYLLEWINISVWNVLQLWY